MQHGADRPQQFRLRDRHALVMRDRANERFDQLPFRRRLKAIEPGQRLVEPRRPMPEPRECRMNARQESAHARFVGAPRFLLVVAAMHREGGKEDLEFTARALRAQVAGRAPPRVERILELHLRELA